MKHGRSEVNKAFHREPESIGSKTQAEIQVTDSTDMTEQAPGVGDGQGSLTCCSPWGHKEPDMIE